MEERREKARPFELSRHGGQAGVADIISVVGEELSRRPKSQTKQTWALVCFRKKRKRR